MKVNLSDSLKDCPLFSEIQASIDLFSKKDSADSIANLIFEEGILKLTSDRFSTVYCDFTEKSFLKEVRQSYGRSEGVYSFVKPLSKQGKIKICDMTVGMGKDFFKFILTGHQVIGFERNPIFYFMVKDGLDRFLKSDKAEELKTQFRVSSFQADLRLGEALFESDSDFDLIYYDPMFEDKSKKAAPKKGMQALKYLNDVSTDNDKIDSLKKAVLSEPRSLIFKCSSVPKDFPYVVKKEHKGKGFSYVYL